MLAPATVVPILSHPATPTAWVRSLKVEVSLDSDGDLNLRYRLTCDLARLRLSETVSPTRQDGLWRHTCFELFAAGHDGPAYREFNFSPAGAWQAYTFRGYRDGGLLEPAAAPAIRSEHLAEELRLAVRLPAGSLPAGVKWRLGLSAVLESADASLSYWALRHPPGQPDFHHPDTFALDLDSRNLAP